MQPLWQILEGDVREQLRALPARSAQMCVCSPPYWLQRKYSDDPREIGCEKSLDEYIATLVGVFREARRVLTRDATLWVNIGDCFMGSRHGKTGKTSGLTNPKRHDEVGFPAALRRVPGLHNKDMVGVPWRLAFALQADGWRLRSDIIWSKPSPMPSPASDRPTAAHEYVFLFGARSRYFYDAEAVREPAVSSLRQIQRAHDRKRARGSKTGTCGGAPVTEASFSRALETRHIRDVWTVAAVPSGSDHSAVFPPALVEPCVLAGSRPGDTVLDVFCGQGTTGEVAIGRGRRFVGIELHSPTVAEARARCARAAERMGTAGSAEAEALGRPVQLGLLGRTGA